MIPAKKILAGLKVLSKYCKQNESVQSGPEYVVYAPHDIMPTDQDLQILADNGWYVMDGFWHIGEVQ